MVLQRLDSRKKPKRQFLLFGKLVCPLCRGKLSIRYLEPESITMRQPDTNKILAIRSFQKVLFECNSCSYKYDWFEEVSHWET